MQPNFHLQREEQNRLTYARKTFSSINTPVHFHSQIEIYMVLSGELEVLINDRTRVLKAGEIAVSFSYDAHGYRSANEVEVLYLIVPTDLCGEFSALLAGKHTGSPFINDPATCQTVRSALERIGQGANELSTRGYIYVILGAILALIPTEKKSETPPSRFSAELLIYVNKHFKEELTLTHLSTAFGYNSAYLSRTFQKTFGISFGRYLSMIRLREAILLLRDRKKNVTECALESGFGSVRSFYRAFYEEFKCTPKEYLQGETQQ